MDEELGCDRLRERAAITIAEEDCTRLKQKTPRQKLGVMF